MCILQNRRRLFYSHCPLFYFFPILGVGGQTLFTTTLFYRIFLTIAFFIVFISFLFFLFFFFPYNIYFFFNQGCQTLLAKWIGGAMAGKVLPYIRHYTH